MRLLTEHFVIGLASFNKKRVPNLFTNRYSVDLDGTEHRETFWYIFYDFLIWFILGTCFHNGTADGGTVVKVLRYKSEGAG
jgi:hypothetical protein